MPLRQSAVARWLPERSCAALAASLIVFAAALHVLYLAANSRLDLAPDEAHYWDWSRHLDWSYYSKGPLVAWLIRLSCSLFGGLSVWLTGNLTMAVRLPAVVCGSLLLASLYLLTVQVLGRPRLALGVVACGLTLPLITVGSSIMTIDAPYTCCWGWALVFAHRAITGRSGWGWEATGVMVGIGILAKYTMVLFIPSLAVFLLTSRDHRRLLWSAGFWKMVGLAAFCCLPIAVWNAQNGWVTVLHVRRLAGLAAAGETALRQGGRFHWSGPPHYLGMQAALLLGWWFVAWVAAMVAYNPLRTTDSGLRFLWWLSAPMFLLFLAFSPKTGGGEPNWPVTAYLSGTVLVAAWLSEQFDSPRAWYRWVVGGGLAAVCAIGLAVSLAVHCSHLLHPVMAALAGPPTPKHPYPARRFDPTCRLRGWRFLAARVDQVCQGLRGRGIEPVLGGVSWAVPGELGVYCDGHPQAYNLGRVQGDRFSQYDHWPNPIDQAEPFAGRTFVLVGPISPRVALGFDRVYPPIEVTYIENGRTLASWTIHVCHGYHGFPDVPPAPH
ncbi:MAG: glycosyltransferase family 39 protein [Gemmataceae bacterium]